MINKKAEYGCLSIAIALTLILLIGMNLSTSRFYIPLPDSILGNISMYIFSFFLIQF